MSSPVELINFSGHDWIIIRAWLQESKEKKISMLIGADTHDRSNMIRGSLAQINELLALEKAADKAAP